MRAPWEGNVAELDLADLNARFEGAAAEEILLWAASTFGDRVAASSSFQTQSVPLLHLISLHTPEMPVLFLDTGFHFPETLAFRDELARRLGLRIRNIEPEMGHDDFRIQYGQLHQRDPDMCCYINKVEPLEAALRGLDAWVTGIRRDQTAHRRQSPIVSLDGAGRVKICPIANWDRRKVWKYLAQHNLPEHPLTDKGYMSIGCAPCTRPALAGQDERSGRWAGQTKTECGLHLPSAGQPGRSEEGGDAAAEPTVEPG